jgi:hypothetical protein
MVRRKRCQPSVPGQRDWSSKKGTSTVLEQHDFTKPWARQRKQVYIWSSVVALLITVIPFLMVGLGYWPMEPTGYIVAAAICVPIIAPMVAAWWDAPGENRTTLEKVNEFMIVWFPITAASQIFWELPWLIGDAFGKMNLTDADHWRFVWYFYGVADTRYLHSDPGLFGMETVAVIGGIILIIQSPRLLTAGHNVAKRINALWWAFFAMSLMLAVITIYYVAETRAGYVNIEQGSWGFGLKFIFMNIPWAVAPAVSLPFVTKQLAYLYRTSGMQTAANAATESGGLVGTR